MLSAYVNASDMEGAEKFFTRLKQDGLKPNEITYATLIKGYARTNNLEKMMEKYEEMKKVNGIKLNQKILTIIMDAYGKNMDFGSAVVWYKEMESRGLTPDQKAKNILLSLAKTSEEQNEAYQLVGLADQCSKEPRVNGVSKFVDDDEDEDEDDDYHDDDVDDDDEYDVPSHVNIHDEKQDELTHLVGDHQESLQDLHALEIC